MGRLVLGDEEVKMECPRHTQHYVCTYHSIYSCFSPMQIVYGWFGAFVGQINRPSGLVDSLGFFLEELGRLKV